MSKSKTKQKLTVDIVILGLKADKRSQGVIVDKVLILVDRLTRLMHDIKESYKTNLFKIKTKSYKIMQHPLKTEFNLADKKSTQRLVL